MPSATEAAAKRLEAALHSLEAAVRQRLSQAGGAEELADEVAMLSADRARLAESLDRSQARALKLEHVNRDVSRRLEAAADSVRAVLGIQPEKP